MDNEKVILFKPYHDENVTRKVVVFFEGTNSIAIWAASVEWTSVNWSASLAR